MEDTTWFEVSPKLFQVRFYNGHKDKYCASFQVFADGDRGFIYSLIGDGFYSMFPKMLPKIMEECGVKSIEASVAMSHYRAMAHALKDIANVEITGEVMVSGREMVWIKITII